MRSVKPSIGFSIAVLTASSVLSVAAAGEREPDRETYALQYDFGTASNLVVEPRWQSAPEDVAAILKHIAAHLVVGKPTFANIGEEWATTDAVRVDLIEIRPLAIYPSARPNPSREACSCRAAVMDRRSRHQGPRIVKSSGLASRETELFTSA